MKRGADLSDWVAADRDGLFKAIADPSRRKILGLLSNSELPLKRLEEQFEISRPALLKHLRVLKTCRLVKTRRRGRETLHRLDSRPLRKVRNWVEHFEFAWQHRLEALKRQVEADVD
jgi:DNA-binding transcriptional ArsR family regulator